ncbi:MAG TPA: hypothetical protein VMU29_01120 [Smithella sp.]|nr:hypothetical protein [Smithella sp.]
MNKITHLWEVGVSVCSLSESVLESLVTSNQQFLNALTGFWVAIWVFVFTVSRIESDPRKIGSYKRLNIIFSLVTIEIVAGEILTAIAIAFKDRALEYVSLLSTIIILVTGLIGAWRLSRSVM